MMTRIPFYLHACFLILLLTSCGSDESDDSMMEEGEEMMETDLGTWTFGQNILTARKEIANATVIHENKIYVLGGVERNGTISDKLEIYDIDMQAWASAAPIPKNVWRASAAIQNGKIYLFGGYESLNPFPFSPSNEVFEYDISTDTWEQKSNMPVPRGASAAVALENKIHLIGGANSSALSRHDIYDPILDQWDTAPAMSATRSGLTAIAVENKIYVFGGYDLSAGVVSKRTGEVFDNDGWSSITSIPIERHGIDAAAIGNTIYLIGGSSSASQTTLSYSISENSWTVLADMPTPVSFMGVVSTVELIYAIGGGAVNLNRTDAVSNMRIFDPPN